MEYYSGLKKRETLTHATTWMSLEDIMLSETRQSQKDKEVLLDEVTGVVKDIETHSRTLSARGRGQVGRRELLSKGHRVTVLSGDGW